jgi:hypothetical protein
MVNQNLVVYIQNSLQQGADINLIRKQLLQQGYNQYEIEAAIGFLYNRPAQVHHTISFSKSAIMGIVAVMLGVALTVYLVFLLTAGPTAPAKLLDFETSALKTAVKPGENIVFTVRLFNMGNSPRYDVAISASVFDKNNIQIAKKEDTFAVEKRTTETMQIQIPTNAKPGAYSVRSVATYQQGKASSSFEFTVYQESATPTCHDNVQNQGETGVDCGGSCDPCATCFDGIQNQGETGVDCGGQCKPCDISCGDCDDNNPCTEDKCANGQCVHTAIAPCCGNGICENNEESCADCAGSEETPKDIIEKARQMSVSDINQAGKICNSLREIRDKDMCFDVVAKTVNQSIVCDYINSSTSRDACYMHFAMRYDYSVCDKVDSQYLKKSCESLKYIKSVEK